MITSVIPKIRVIQMNGNTPLHPSEYQKSKESKYSHERDTEGVYEALPKKTVFPNKKQRPFILKQTM